MMIAAKSPILQTVAHFNAKDPPGIALYVLGGDWFARWLRWNWTTIEATQALVPLRLSRPQGILRLNLVSILLD